jgi:hypothetical protein
MVNKTWGTFTLDNVVTHTHAWRHMHMHTHTKRHTDTDTQKHTCSAVLLQPHASLGCRMAVRHDFRPWNGNKQGGAPVQPSQQHHFRVELALPVPLLPAPLPAQLQHTQRPPTAYRAEVRTSKVLSDVSAEALAFSCSPGYAVVNESEHAQQPPA